jgi:hypothetical protein
MKQAKYALGWDEDPVRRVLEHYVTRSDDETAAEDEVACHPQFVLKRQS